MSLNVAAEEIIPFYTSTDVETSNTVDDTLSATEIRTFLCGPPPPWPELKILNGDKTQLQSDSAEMREKDVTTFTGDVVIKRETNQLEADIAYYFHKTDDIKANGNVRLFTPEVMFTADSGTFNFTSEQATISNATYKTKQSGSNGTAEQIKRTSPQRIEMINASYTTCVSEEPEWVLNADTLLLDNETRQGHATHSVIRFMGVPFFYFPYLRFPIGEERLSGFLFPLFGNSDTNGAEIILPYYWDIAPNYDATITPWYLDYRGGTMLMTEFRYLHDENLGQIEVDYMDRDILYGESRQRVSWQHQSTSVEGWATDVNYRRVTDTDHYIDFGEMLDDERPSHLEQSATLSYNTTNWTTQVKTQAWQEISGSIPFELMPKIVFNTRFPERENQWYPGLDFEAVNFYRSDTSVQGTRLNIAPYLALPLSNEAMFITPKLTWLYTHYKLKNTTSAESSEPSRDIPVLSINSGIFLERNLKINSSDYLQTLEPQLFYVYAPYRDQNNIPVLDTGTVSFNINDPIRENRFSSVDRIEDADRLNALLTTRFIDDETGEEKFMARIGQAFYFDDRDVTLPSETVPTQTRTSYIAELVSRPVSNLYMAADTQWDPATKDYSTGNARLTYDNPRHINLDINYRYQNDSLETNEIDLSWKFNPRWKISTQKLYDIRNHRALENEHTIEYESCCWALKFSTKELFMNINEPYEKSFYLELELKGLTSFGRGIQKKRNLEQYR